MATQTATETLAQVIAPALGDTPAAVRKQGDGAKYDEGLYFRTDSATVLNRPATVMVTVVFRDKKR